MSLSEEGYILLIEHTVMTFLITPCGIFKLPRRFAHSLTKYHREKKKHFSQRTKPDISLLSDIYYLKDLLFTSIFYCEWPLLSHCKTKSSITAFLIMKIETSCSSRSTPSTTVLPTKFIV